MDSSAKAKQEELKQQLDSFEVRMKENLEQKMIYLDDQIEKMQAQMKETRLLYTSMRAELRSYKGQFLDLDDFLGGEGESEPSVCANCGFPLQRIFKCCPICGNPVPRDGAEDIDYPMPAGPVVNHEEEPEEEENYNEEDYEDFEEGETYENGEAYEEEQGEEAYEEEEEAYDENVIDQESYSERPADEEEEPRGFVPKKPGAVPPPPSDDDDEEVYPTYVNGRTAQPQPKPGAVPPPPSDDDDEEVYPTYVNGRAAQPQPKPGAVPPPPSDDDDEEVYPTYVNGKAAQPQPKPGAVPPPPSDDDDEVYPTYVNGQKYNPQAPQASSGDDDDEEVRPTYPTAGAKYYPKFERESDRGNQDIPTQDRTQDNGGGLGGIFNRFSRSRKPIPSQNQPTIQLSSGPQAPPPDDDDDEIYPTYPGGAKGGAPEPERTGAGVLNPKTPEEISDAIIYHIVNDKTVTIDRVILPDCKIIYIPETIEDKPVTVIGPRALAGYETVQEVYLRPGITFISTEAFKGCVSLRRVAIPETVEHIRNYAFAGCEKLSDVSIPAKATDIGVGVFYNCSALDSVTFPEGLTFISENCLAHCKSLREVTLPSTIVAIEQSAFTECGNLMGLTIPEGCVRIADKALYNCKSLSRVSMPGSLTRFGNRVFFPKMGQNMLPKLVIHASNGSAAANYAKTNGIKLKVVNGMVPSQPPKNMCYRIEFAAWLADKDDIAKDEMTEALIEALKIPECLARDYLVEERPDSKELHPYLVVNMEQAQADALARKILPGITYVLKLHTYDGEVDLAAAGSSPIF